LKIYISQGSEATQLRCGGIFSNYYRAYYKFPTKYAGKNFKKIGIFGEYMDTRLQLTFWGHPA